MGTILQDLRYGVRMLIKSRAFTLVAVLALALGIGANTAIFSVVNAVLLRKLPYAQPERVVRIWGTNTQQSVPRGEGDYYDFNISTNDFADWRASNHVFESIAVFSSLGSVTLTGRDEPVRLRCPVVSADFFKVLGVQPALGRFFLPEEEQQGKHRAVVLSYGTWQGRFNADPNIVGQTLVLSGNSYTVVGVAPKEFEHPRPNPTAEPEMWRPLALQLEPGERNNHWLHAIARLKPGVTTEQAQAEMNLINGQLERQYPDSNTGRGVRLSSLHESMVGNIRSALSVLFGAVGFVLLIACANVANLLLARSSTRQREMAIRTALGASRLRVIRQLLTESVLLSVLGGALGLLIALWATDLLIGLSGGEIPRLSAISIDARMLGFTAAVSLLTGIIFGLAPALEASRPDLNVSLKEGGRVATGRGRQRFRQALIVSEVALSLVLLIGAGLMMKSFWRLQHVNLGFNPENLLTMYVSLPQTRYPEQSQAALVQQRIVERISALPGVASAASVSILPLSGGNSCDGVMIEGRPAATASDVPCVEVRSISPDYFRTMGVPLVRGRALNDHDTSDAPAVVVVNESLVRRLFPGEDPLGRRINHSAPDKPQVWREIVGVVGDIRHFGPDAEARPEFYEPQLQAPNWGTGLVVRASGDLTNLAAAVRGEVRALDPDLPVYNLKSMEELVSETVAQPRFRTLLLAIFAAVALLLSATGLYGVMNYWVTQRTREIGVRMALGAQARDVLRMVVGQGMILAAIGVAVGLVAAFGLTRLINSLLFNVSATDPLTFACVALALCVVAFLASYLPARRATKVDPMVALRYE
ncbi:MAG TPA: ABC transporter permease [Pyrinomonadaceae bacterium]|jgi:putative ABC transport system permease protein|nr:ABC transporter permease [Pyrinomonadaceae bacterium]